MKLEKYRRVIGQYDNKKYDRKRKLKLYDSKFTTLKCNSEPLQSPPTSLDSYLPREFYPFVQTFTADTTLKFLFLSLTIAAVICPVNASSTAKTPPEPPSTKNDATTIDNLLIEAETTATSVLPIIVATSTVPPLDRQLHHSKPLKNKENNPSSFFPFNTVATKPCSEKTENYHFNTEQHISITPEINVLIKKQPKLQASVAQQLLWLQEIFSKDLAQYFDPMLIKFSLSGLKINLLSKQEIAKNLNVPEEQIIGVFGYTLPESYNIIIGFCPYAKRDQLLAVTINEMYSLIDKRVALSLRGFSHERIHPFVNKDGKVDEKRLEKYILNVQRTADRMQSISNILKTDERLLTAAQKTLKDKLISQIGSYRSLVQIIHPEHIDKFEKSRTVKVIKVGEGQEISNGIRLVQYITSDQNSTPQEKILSLCADSIIAIKNVLRNEAYRKDSSQWHELAGNLWTLLPNGLLKELLMPELCAYMRKFTNYVLELEAEKNHCLTSKRSSP